MGSLMSYKRPQGFGRIPVKKSGPEPHAGKPDAVKVARPVWSGLRLESA
jgi:hypothetical protein